MSKGTWSIAVVVLAALAAGCQSPKESSSADALAYAGASSISENLFPQFIPLLQERTKLTLSQIATVGSREGVRYVTEGKADIGGVTHKLTPDELSRNPYVKVIGYDAVTVMVNSENPVTSLTRPQLKGIFTGQITNWKALGWKDLPIETISMAVKKSYGVPKVFQDTILDGAAYGPISQEKDFLHLIAPAVEEKPGAIGMVSAAYQAPRARPVAIDGIAPLPANIRSGTYPLTREVILVAKQSPEGKVKQFFDLIMSPEGQAIVGKKFIPAK